jgi:hypothetical protein
MRLLFLSSTTASQRCTRGHGDEALNSDGCVGSVTPTTVRRRFAGGAEGSSVTRSFDDKAGLEDDDEDDIDPVQDASDMELCLWMR